MRISFKKSLLLLLLPIVLLLSNASPCYANSPPPPSVFIIVPHAPKDLVLTIGSVQPQRRDKAFESYFGFFFQHNKPANVDYLEVNTGNTTYQITLPPLTSYTTTFTLDLKHMTLTKGASSLRPYAFASITIILTLLIEGIVFYLFGYRKKSSWIIFLVTNLITQGFLYVWLNKMVYPSYQAYTILYLIFGEFWVFIIEIFAFVIPIRERRRLETFLYVLMANLISLFAGGFLVIALI